MCPFSDLVMAIWDIFEDIVDAGLSELTSPYVPMANLTPPPPKKTETLETPMKKFNFPNISDFLPYHIELGRLNNIATPLHHMCKRTVVNDRYSSESKS